MQEKLLDAVIAECVRVLQIKPAKYAIKPRVLILGPRGSGRKTQARLLASNLNIIYGNYLLFSVYKLEKKNSKVAFIH